MLARVIEQEIFPSEVLKARAKESFTRKRRVSVDADEADMSTSDTIATATPVRTDGTLPTNNVASHVSPPNTLPLGNDTDIQTREHENQVNNHII